MFERDAFIEDCIAAQSEGEKAVREVLARAVAEPSAVLRSLGEPTHAGIDALYKSKDLTILNVIWAPLMTVLPHNHNMWALIGIYTGREDNIFWRRQGDRVEAAGAKALSERDVAPLGKDVVHSVTNPIDRFSGAIHIYGGDFFAMERSEWDPETLRERPYNVATSLRLFEEANARYAAAASA